MSRKTKTNNNNNNNCYYDFETSVIMTLLPYLGSPVNVAVGVCSKSRPKQATKENVPLMKASAPSVFDQWESPGQVNFADLI